MVIGTKAAPPILLEDQSKKLSLSSLRLRRTEATERAQPRHITQLCPRSVSQSAPQWRRSAQRHYLV